MKKIFLIIINILLVILLIFNIVSINNKKYSNSGILLSFANEDVIEKYEIEYFRINVLLNINDLESKSCVFSIDDEKSQEIEIQNGECSYVFDDLKEDTTYKIKIEIKDNFGKINKEINKEIKTLTNLSKHIKELSNYSLDENGVYYHNAKLNLGAKDNSYRYAGKNEKINNWVCFGSDVNPCPEDNLYRIIGTFDKNNNGKYQVKLIAADYVNEEYLGKDGNRNTSGYEFNTNNNYLGKKDKINTFFWSNKNYDLSDDWKDSELNTINLNKNFYNKLGKWNKLIDNNFWQINGIEDYSGVAQEIYNNEIQNNNNVTFDDEIGLMYVSDYMYAAFPKNWQIKASEYSQSKDENWMYLGANEWTITKMNNNEQKIIYINENGNVDKYTQNILSYAVRPVFYLNENVGYTGGTGEENDPYRISLFDDNIATVCRGQYLGNCFSKNSNLDKDLYHHDGNVDYIGQLNAELEAHDGSYRYAGANPHNFVCIDNQERGLCDENNLYRIIGLFAIDTENYAVKLIKNTSIGLKPWNSNSTANTLNGWWDSNLNSFLNDEVNSPLRSIMPYIMEDSWYVDSQNNENMVKQTPLNVYNYEKYITKDPTKAEMIVIAKVGLMYISDYMYAASPEAWTYVGDNYSLTGQKDYSEAKSMNWLAGIDEYVLTSVSGDSSNQAFYLQAGGKVGVSDVTKEKEVRPVFSLLPNVIVKSGIGIKTEPYRLSINGS